MFKKDNSKNNNLLFYSSIFHFLSFLCSSFSDYKNNDAQILSLNYFFYFLTWWSFHASLITLIAFFYLMIKKIILKNKPDLKNNYWENVFHLIFANSNFVSMIIFILGAFSNIFLGLKVIPVSKREKIFYWTYSTVWHLVAPMLAMKYFCNLDLSSLRENKDKALTHILIHPLVYFLFVVIRAANIVTNKSKYPYSFFEFVMKKRSSFSENLFTEFTFSLSFYVIFYLTSILMLSLNKMNKKKSYVEKLKIEKI